MSDYTFLAAIAGILLIGAMSPGPSFFVVAQSALAKSRTHGIATALGTGLGVALFAILASFGVTTLIETVPSAYLIFKLFGGAYLLYLAFKIWRGAREPLVTESLEGKSSGTLFQSFLLGLITQTSNPKTALVIAGIFAAFVPANPPQYTTLAVSIIAFVIDFSWYAVVALSLSTSRTRGVYQRAKTGFDRTAAVFLGAVGIKLLLSKLSS
ncbi:LysE family translocator [Arenicella xantha]|uniref:Threonine/homoserine/homoserine lactone efflux protein n=1 Tax=Arenicella xantha TaxID=644221 RepID=A0A395JPT1_9GAMM|nr:LysE family translocator [Arenicella xantha]RBP53651.1 threonine/homoserine/homoserine lactone efflux protein [Arenicella xantha]